MVGRRFQGYIDDDITHDLNMYKSFKIFVASIFSVKPQLVSACFRTIETSRLIHTHSSFNPAEEATKRG